MALSSDLFGGVFIVVALATLAIGGVVAFAALRVFGVGTMFVGVARIATFGAAFCAFVVVASLAGLTTSVFALVKACEAVLLCEVG